VDGARSNDNQKTVISAVQDAMDCLPRFVGDFGGLFGSWSFTKHVPGGQQLLDLLDS
jgi:hypothetical protein